MAFSFRNIETPFQSCSTGILCCSLLRHVFNDEDIARLHHQYVGIQLQNFYRCTTGILGCSLLRHVLSDEDKAREIMHVYQPEMHVT